jgi:glycosyltransferase involved in cell wall biosynthesis
MQLIRSNTNTLPRPLLSGTGSYSAQTELKQTETKRAHRQPLIYVLHSTEMYGTERMALATALGLAEDFEVIFLGPNGPAMEEARKLGFETRRFQTTGQLVKQIWNILRQFRAFTFVSTLPRYSAVCMAVNFLFARKIRHIQMIHGGGNDQKDYKSLRRFNPFKMTVITVSDYCKDQLVNLGVRPDHIEVVGNFLTPQQEESMPRRLAFEHDGVRNVAIVSRIDPPKRVDLLLDALDKRGEELRDIKFRIFGWGPDLDRLRQRAGKYPNVEFVGYVDDVGAELAKSDLLVHTCPVEAFGLAVLEAMTANLPALVPDHGGTAMLVRDGETGFTFHSDDATHLAARLVELKNAPARLLNRIALSARESCDARFSAESSLARYRKLFSAAN